MYNKILWTLDNEMSPDRFERLCTDILSREGYKDIVHIGGSRDHGRDAELTLFKGLKTTGGVTFFQYTLEKKWESKFYDEINKIKKYGHKIDFYVFVSSQKISGEKRDKLAEKTNRVIGCHLIIYDREWLRHRLDEVHPDLSTKYFGLYSSELSASNKEDDLKPSFPEDLTFDKLWQLYNSNDYELSAIEIKGLLKSHHKSNALWAMLAWCQYCLFHYNEALASINRALNINENEINALAVKGCILAENGISTGSRASLLKAKDIFLYLAENLDRWVDHYNFGNTLSALGEFKSAEKQFLKAIKMNSQKAEIWKNLGDVYLNQGKHKKEIQCYDKALLINPYKVEALVSKATTLHNIYNDHSRCIQLIEQALKYEENIGIKWPNVFYWLSKAYLSLDNYDKALENADLGLSFIPEHLGLLDLKSKILSKFWRIKSEFIEVSIDFFNFRLKLSQNDYDSFCELMYLFNEIGKEDQVYEEINSFVDFGDINFTKYLEYMDHSYEDYLTSFRYIALYNKYRFSSPIDVYFDFMRARSINVDQKFSDALFIIFSVPFGLSCEILNKELKRKKITALKNVYNVIQKSLGYSLPLVCKNLLPEFKKDTMADIASGLADRIVLISFVSILELSRQYGFIGGMFGVEPKDLDYILTNKVKTPEAWQSNIICDSLFEMNKELKIFKE